MALNKKQLAVIHVGKKDRNLSDGQYRSILLQLAGVESSRDLDQDGFDVVMGYLDHLGFRPAQVSGPDYGNRPGMASLAQLGFIRQLWSEWTRGGTEANGLNTWLRNTFKVDSLRFLTKDQARKAITVLKAMKARQAA